MPGPADGEAAPRTPAVNAAVSGVLAPPGELIPYQSWGSVRSRSGVTQV